ncbi:MAG: hypothetical protein H6550_07710 [Chitinophagales bacterium]|nr:hypothetical protein [Chitinophagales bacterium]
MEESTRKSKNFLRRLNDNYRVVFIDDESLEEVASYRLTMRKLYILICTLFVLVAIVTLSLVMFTPVKYYIPGYAGGKNRLEIVRLKQNVDSLSDLVAAQELYQENIRNIITGNMKTPLDTSLLDLKKTRQEEINSLLPASQEIMKQAAKSVKKEKESEKKKRK